MDSKKYQPVIGLEVHVELKTKSKMFCGCSADYFGQKPNTHTCPVCLGLPGALPVPNKKAIEWCVMIGMALNCEIPLFSKFDRKNYFYPDLAKGYQISQYDQPFCLKGSIKLSNGKTIGITRVHMEEDTAKLIHQFGTQNSKLKTQNDEGYSLIDFNRSGVPLVEIVTEPNFETAEEVKEYLRKLHQLVRALGVSNADMEKGDMRLEPNISLKREGQIDLPSYKVEVKNINSFNFVGKAIEFEIKRQAEILDKGEKPTQETRGFNEAKNSTVSQRSKEEAHDYRYFPEPDIPPFRWNQEYLDKLRASMPKLTEEKQQELINKYNINPVSAATIVYNPDLYRTFASTASIGQEAFGTAYEVTANMLINKKLPYIEVSSEELAKNIANLTKVSNIDDNKLEKIIDEVILENEKAVEDYKNGKETVIMFLIGLVMKKAQQKLDAQMVKEKIIQKLK